MYRIVISIVFSPRFSSAWRAHAQPQPLRVPPVPAAVAALAMHPTGDPHPCLRRELADSYASRGELVWRTSKCRWCHGDEAHGDGETASALLDEWGNHESPMDPTYKWELKNGYDPADLYRSIFGGLNGSAMQSYASDFSEDRDRWLLIGYILSLSPEPRPLLRLADFATERARRIGTRGRVLQAIVPSSVR